MGDESQRYVVTCRVCGDVHDVRYACRIPGPAPASPPGEAPATEQGAWWCPSCREEVDGSRVTYQERHDACGTAVEWVEGWPSISATLALALAAAAGERRARAQVESEAASLRAEVEMLRGVGCEEDGDGPCGACLKCARADFQREREAREEADGRVQSLLAEPDKCDRLEIGEDACTCRRCLMGQVERANARAEAAEQAKDGAYRERDRCVALAARLARILHWPAWLGQHIDKPGDPPWDADWRNIVFIDLPAGQVSWHIHDSELPFVTFLPRREESWDGHDTAEKYRRCEAPWPSALDHATERASGAEQRVREVEGERDEAVEGECARACERDAALQRVKELERERDEAQRAKYGTPCKCESWIETCRQAETERDAALSDRAALLELLRELDPYVSAKYGMPDELVVRLAAALAPGAKP